MPDAGNPPAGAREARSTSSPDKRVGRHPAADSDRQQSLFLPPPPGDAPEPQGGSRRLWLCLYLSRLPLDASAVEDPALPCAVAEDRQGVRRVLLANARAAAAGIRPGMSVNAALALLPTLCLEERRPAREMRALQKLAGWAERFTSFVSIEPPATVLLELAGSLRLFGGLKAMERRIAAGLERQGFHAERAIAPTPRAATWLAKAGGGVCLEDRARLTSALARLPLHCLDWPDAVIETLEGMGISAIGDCLRLPRQGFARRFGAACLLELDRALGRAPDPRPHYRTAETFDREYELTEEQSDSALLLHACRELLEEFASFLLRRQLTVQRVRFSFFHLRLPATHLTLGCAAAGRSIGHWCELLAIRFEGLRLPAPVTAIRLRGGRGRPLAAAAGRLPFGQNASRSRCASILELVERLSARMGDEAVHGVMTVAEHRPQHAWRVAASFGEQPRCAAPPSFRYERYAPQLLAELRRNNRLLLRRPLWMLSEPAPLAAEDGRPVYHGVLILEDGPERLETGWWDEDGIARDYFVARSPAGLKLWVFRDRGRHGHGRGGWYLHGIFG